jgi:hypothetical protein
LTADEESDERRMAPDDDEEFDDEEEEFNQDVSRARRGRTYSCGHGGGDGYRHKDGDGDGDRDRARENAVVPIGRRRRVDARRWLKKLQVANLGTCNGVGAVDGSRRFVANNDGARCSA